MEKYVEHYFDLYSRQNVVTTVALDVIECLPVMEEVDTEPTTGGHQQLGLRESLRQQQDPPDLTKHYATTLLFSLHEVLCQCWKEGAVPQDMRDAKFITLYKHKGDRSDCNNYRGISLLSIVGKVFARVILGLSAETCLTCLPRVSVQFPS